MKTVMLDEYHITILAVKELRQDELDEIRLVMHVCKQDITDLIASNLRQKTRAKLRMKITQ